MGTMSHRVTLYWVIASTHQGGNKMAYILQTTCQMHFDIRMIFYEITISVKMQLGSNLKFHCTHYSQGLIDHEATLFMQWYKRDNMPLITWTDDYIIHWCMYGSWGHQLIISFHCITLCSYWSNRQEIYTIWICIFLRTELFWCQLCYHWWHWRLSLWQVPHPTTICKLVDLIPALHQSDCRIPNWVSAKTMHSSSTNYGQTTACFWSLFW